MKFLSFVYLGYMFVSLYFLSLFLLLYARNKKDLFKYPKSKKIFSISVIVPAYNEQDTIQDTVETILQSDYHGLKEVLIIDDGSKDNTLKIARKLARKYKKVKAFTKENKGSKADPLNFGLKRAKSELIAVVDADSYPGKDALSKLAPYFKDKKIGVATGPIVVRNPTSFIEKLQAIEYRIIAFTRKLLGYVDAIYVTPGPLALYRKSALQKIGGFDTDNLTEDIEATWNLTHHGYKRQACLATETTTTAPHKYFHWFKQRKRWNIGGIQCINKYKSCFFKKGMLGFFILPFFVLQTFLGLVGLSIFIYLTSSRLIKNYLFASYSFKAGSALITMEDLFITPSVLNYLGIVLFILGAVFTLLVLSVMKKRILQHQNIFNIVFYLLIYLASYPFIMVFAIIDLITKKHKWE